MGSRFYDGIGIPEKPERPTFIVEKGKRTYYFFNEKSLPTIKESIKDFPLKGFPDNYILGNKKNGEICFFRDALETTDRISKLNHAHTITFGLGNGYEEVYIRKKINGL